MGRSRDSCEKSSKPRESKRSFRSWLKKIVVSGVTAVVLLGLYIVWFISGRPTATVDYVALLNQKNRPENQEQGDNAWPHYRKAIELFVGPNAPDGYTRILGTSAGKLSKRSEPEQVEIIDWVAKNDAAWKEFIEASLKPYCYIEYVVLDETAEGLAMPNVPTFRVDMKHLTQFRHLFMLGLWRSQIQAERGNIQRALNDCLTVVNSGRHLGRDKFLMEQLVGLWAHRIGHRGILEIAATQELSVVELKDLQQRLSNIYQDTGPAIDMEYEKLQFLDTVQHTFTRGGIGGGHLIPRFLPPLVRAHSVVITMRELETEPTVRQKALYAATAIVHARRKKSIAKYDRMCDQIDQIVGMTPYERRAANISFGVDRPHIFNYMIHFESFLKESRYFLPEISMPAVDRMAEVVHQARGINVATKTVLALQRWRLETGEYPAELKQLVEGGYLDELPMDPFSNDSFIYKKMDGDFTLYSVGRNFADDEGEIAYQGKTHPALWGTTKKGDAVFWPHSR